MNIVKGVADLIRKTSGGQSTDFTSGSSSARFTPPTPVIHFSEVGDEGMLKTLWGRFEKAIDKEEKRKLLKIFLEQFLVVYQTWEPINLGESPDGASSIPFSNNQQNASYEVVGCSGGHPSEIISNLIEELRHITTLIMEWTLSSTMIVNEALVVLDGLAVMTRSMHNCRVLGYYGGIQKLTALMKACVVQLKEITSVLSGDESLPDMAVEKIALLQKILAHAVLIFCNFVNLLPDPYEKDQLSKGSMGFIVPRTHGTATGPSKSVEAHISDRILRWQQKAIVSLMEAGGLNWLVELLRVMRRLSMKEFWTDMSLQYLTLRTLRSALADNPRGQNHFRSIGGLEVLLDGLGISSSSALRLKEFSTSETIRTENPLLGSFQLHVLSLLVLREAVFGNLNNLQFLCENGRVQKFANSFCSLAFSLQEYEKLNAACGPSDEVLFPDLKDMHSSELSLTNPSTPCTLINLSIMRNWSDYVTNLSTVLCSFLLALDLTKQFDVQPSAGRSNMQLPSVYSQLSVKWFVRVLLTVFPCVRACSNQTEMPVHLRKFVYTLQRSVLYTFRKVLVLTPSLLDVFRAEGVWDFFFSENFFYFAPASDELSGDKLPSYDGVSLSSEYIVDPRGRTNVGEFEVVQIEVISFMEFAAALSGSSQNLAECSILLDALEQSACNPEVARALAKSLLRILQISEEKTSSSFKTLDAIPRVLKVACVQVQESRRSRGQSSYTGSSSSETLSGEINQHWHKSIEASIELFTAYFSGSYDAKSHVLHSSACIDSLLELFWEESLRSRMLTYILELMKDCLLSSLDWNAKLYVCSKYLEAFTHVKEREVNFADLSIDLLTGMQDMLKSNQKYYQDMFREAECFLHVVSLLNGNLDMANGEKLVLNVLQTLTSLLSGNDVSKASFRALVGKGYLTLQSLLLDFCQGRPSEVLLNALLDMLVDGRFDVKVNIGIKNEDVVLLYLSVMHKSSDSSVHNGLNVFLQLLRDSLSNRASCVRSGMLNFLLDWFSEEGNDSVVLKLAQLIQIIGGHSISGKDIRKIFALLRSEKVGSQQSYCSLLLNSMLAMLNEKGPTAFIDLNGIDSGITIKTPIQWPLNKGYSFTCWLRIENFPRSGAMGLFSFLTENGKGCYAVLAKDRLIYESYYQKRQSISLPVNLTRKKWHLLCLTHTIGRPFSGGSLLRCYLDGGLVSSDKCRYAKVNEPLTMCTIGSKVFMSSDEEDNTMPSIKDSSPFFGQIGPLYLFNDAITSEQVQGIHSLGPSYMYSFLDNESAIYMEKPLAGNVLDAKDGLASKIMFGLNSQASSGRTLFNISPQLEHVLDKNFFEATVQSGSQLCSRRLLQQIIYCVGGVSVFFPLFTQSALYRNGGTEQAEQNLLTSVRRDHVAADIIELIASVLDENLANQQQMLLLSGFSVLGFLLQSIPPQHLNMETLTALKHLFNVVMNCALSEKLVQDAISSIFLNPLIWIHTVYKVQRELYMFLIQQFDNDPRLLKNLCRLPRVLDIITEYYCDDMKGNSTIDSKLHVNSVRNQVTDRPTEEEIHKIRLLLLSLGEMSLRQHILVSDMRALVTFFETNQDMSCIEDVLHMIIRALSQKSLLASFLEQVNLLGGCHIFVNLLQRELEPIRLLSLQFLGRLLVGLPLEKKGLKFFNIAMGRSKSLSDSRKKINLRMQPIFHLMSDRLFKFPQTEILCATLFDVLLGGASPKQVLQRHNQLDRQRSSRQNSQFFLPHILVLIFKFLAGCEVANMRKKILSDLLDLLDSNPSNIEALMEYGWNAWLGASVKLDVLSNYKGELGISGNANLEEQNLVRNLYCVVLSHYILSVRGGWQQLEETVEFLLLQSEEGHISYRFLLRDVFKDLIQKLTELSSEDNIFISQPCRDNTLYILKLVDEMLISENDHKLPFPASILDTSPDSMELENHKDLASALFEVLQGESNENLNRDQLEQIQPVATDGCKIDNGWWNLYDNLWVIINEMNGKGSSKMFYGSSSATIPSLGQRARGLVESLNIPAAEMAAVVVSGGIGNALVGKPNRPADKAMLLRGEKCPRIVFRLVVLYLCKASLERACQCIQQVIPLLPCLLTSDDEQSKSRLQLFIWALLTVRSRYGMLDDGARFHVISRLIRETVNSGKPMLINSMVVSNEFYDSGSNAKDSGTIHNLIQKDRVLAAVSDEVKYITTAITDRSKQLQELRHRLDESMTAERDQKKTFEDLIKSSLNGILAFDDTRRASFQLALDEEQQIVTEQWMHTIRSLIDERGPWSTNHFPNNIITHWKLDKTEDRWRRRQKLRRNYYFDERLCRPPSALPTNDGLPASESKSVSSAHIPEQMKRLLLKGIRKITDEGSSETYDSESESNSHKASTMEDASDRPQSEVGRETYDQKDMLHERKDISSLSTEPEDTEVLMSLPCVLVTPRRKIAGRLAVMKTLLHFFGELIVEGTGGTIVFRCFDSSGNFDSSKFDQLESVEKKKFIRLPISSDLYSERGFVNESTNEVHEKQQSNIKRHRRWNVCKIKGVQWTRYLLRYSAIEVFFGDSIAPIFLNFSSQKDAKDVGNLIVTARNDALFPKGYRDKSAFITFIDKRVALEMAESARESWRRRDISNFEYLMILNTLAGRSYNDLTQYPIFPWVLADYSSEVLDFNKSSTFRDLSKPVGALDPKRFEVFEDRYHNFCDPDIPSFYYGSHYSSMGIVLFYLIRLEPFTALHRHLQGDKFDHADRLFQSIEGTYKNCLSNTSDVKELIPEFFYLPEFLVNSNSYYFGRKQDGEPLHDVCLPPWAKGSPEEFISKNREALESEYVSSNLHHWIDLVFGYKQRGKPAVEAANIFYYLTYEGAVDLETMEDELQRSAIEDQIANFGQTPMQIFRKKHPRRGPPIPIAHPLQFAPSSINLTSIVSCTTASPSAVIYVNVLDSIVVLINDDLSMSVKIWLTTQLQSGGNFSFSSSQDPYFGIGSDILYSRRIGSALAENFDLGAQCFATLHTSSENFLISCGNWDNSFQVISLNHGRMVQSIRHHKDVVSCIAVTSDGGILATGSYDTTVMVWEVLRVRTSEKRTRNPQLEVPRKEYIIADTPFHILCGHDDIITCLYASEELDIVISGSKDGTCVFHTLREGRYVRSVQHPSGCSLTKLVVSRHGHVVLYADDDLSLHLYSINGKHIASSESHGRLNCVELSSCGEFLVCAGDQGEIIVRSMNTLQIVRKYSGIGKVTTALTVTPEECFLAGTKDGTLLVYSIENPQLRKSGVVRNVKSKA